MRVAIVHGPAPPVHDGVGDYVRHLVAALRDAGVEACPVAVDPSRGGWPGGVAGAAAAVRRLRPDVVHVQFAPSAYGYSAAVGLLPLLLPAGPPLVTTVHEYGWWAAPRWVPGPLWRPLEAVRAWDRETGRLVPASRRVIVTNAAHGARVRERTGRAAVEIPLAPNVADHGAGPAARRAARRRLGVGPGAFLLVHFGFVHPVKGVRYLLEALPELLAVRPDLHVAVAGGFTSQALPGPQARAFRAELEALAAGLPVTFTGYLPEPGVSALLHAGDAAVLPFTAGATLKSGALVAALAHGVPTATTLPDEPDPALRDGETVVAIPARRDARAVAAAVRRLIDDAGLRERVAAGGRRLGGAHRWPGVADAHRRLYAAAADGRDG